MLFDLALDYAGAGRMALAAADRASAKPWTTPSDSSRRPAKRSH